MKADHGDPSKHIEQKSIDIMNTWVNAKLGHLRSRQKMFLYPKQPTLVFFTKTVLFSRVHETACTGAVLSLCAKYSQVCLQSWSTTVESIILPPSENNNGT